MSWTKNLILGLLAIGGIVYLLNLDTPKTVDSLSKQLPYISIQESNVNRLEINNPGEHFTLSRKTDDHDWRVSGVWNSEVDQERVKLLIDVFRKLKIDQEVFSESSRDLTQYGLDEALTELKVGANGRTYEIQFGNLNRYVGKRYIYFDQGRIGLVSDELFTLTTLPRRAFRARLPISFQDADVAAATLVNPEGRFVFEHNLQSGKWSMLEPFPGRASEESLSEMLRQVRSLEVENFYDFESPEKVDLSRFGLEQPDVMINLRFKPDSGLKDREIRVTQIDPKNFQGKDVNAGFVYQSGSAMVFGVKTDPTEQFSKSFEYYRQRKLFQFASDRVRQVDFQRSGKPPISIIKGDKDDWLVNGKPGDTPFVLDILKNLSELEAYTFPIQQLDFGFSNPILKVLVQLDSDTGEKGAEERLLLIGKKALIDKDVSISAYYAGVDDLSEPFVINHKSYRSIYPREEILVKTNVIEISSDQHEQ